MGVSILSDGNSLTERGWGDTFYTQNVELIFLPVHASNNLSELSLLRPNGSTAIHFPKDFLCSS